MKLKMKIVFDMNLKVFLLLRDLKNKKKGKNEFQLLPSISLWDLGLSSSKTTQSNCEHELRNLSARSLLSKASKVN